MARKRIRRDLPPLVEVFHDFGGFSEVTSKQQALLETLRTAAKALQQVDAQPFYSMREVVEYFKLPLRTVALAYEALELEGILNRIRGSQTLLAGKTTSSREPIRAVVGLPIWLRAMVMSPYSRAWNLELEERLRESGFLADLIFFREDELRRPEFAKRLVQHRLDMVIWHTPHPLSSSTLLSLRDHGVQQIVIQSTETHSSFPLPTYLQDWSPAYQKLADAWLQLGIRRVIIPEPVYLPSKRALKNFSAILTQYGLEVVFTKGSAAHLRETLSESNDKKSCVVAFMDQQGADAICNEEPVIIEEIIRQSRVAFCRGPIRIPYFNHRKDKVDVVGFSPIEMAKRVVDDLNKLPVMPKSIIHTFEPELHLQLAFSTCPELL